MRARGLDPALLGPDALPLADRAAWGAALGKQRGCHVSKYGAPALLPEIEDKDEHLAAALDVEHPFGVPPSLPADL
eukprot:10157286-Lingulodinium_polyedra.AAC.1